jgi:anti-anti-sigma factor
MSSCSVTVQTVDQIAVVEITGYFGETGATLLLPELNAVLPKLNKVILDFSPCNLISSPGVAAVMEAMVRVNEDFQGTLVLCGLDGVKERLFTMAGIIPIIPSHPTREEALASLKTA